MIEKTLQEPIWHIFFADANPRELPWWYRMFTCKGFRHVYAVGQSPYGSWVMISAERGGVVVYTAPDGTTWGEILEHLWTHRPWSVMLTVQGKVTDRPLWPRLPFSCVEMVKQLLGFRSWAITPKGLWKQLAARCKQC